MLHNTHSTLKILLLFFCAAFFSLVSPSLPLAAEDEAPAATPSEDQRSFNERLRGLWGDAKNAGSELGSQAGEMWDSARESSSELWNLLSSRSRKARRTKRNVLFFPHVLRTRKAS